ncbi:unnamed protein product [Phytophthora fragariaefolia]|uniref:Unnamed protein product n=1 Tax=Phytophthora fragariaefolia TaxID=1490495 RepID=A0A9W6YGC7_9STRA|nr:unnamed protein product [Phytophthora fragariaefolia]
MSTPTTQAAGTSAASAAANPVVAPVPTTGNSLASSSVVTSTVTTSSSPKRTISLGEYKKARGNTMFARDELQALFDAGSDSDMEKDEGDEEAYAIDIPLADAGPLSSPRSGGDSTPSGVEASRTDPVRDPWMPTPSEIEGSTAPPNQDALYACGGIKDDDVTMELDFDPATDPRRDYYIKLFHKFRWYGNKKTSRRSKVCNSVLHKPYDGLSVLDKVHCLQAELSVQLGVFVHYSPGLCVWLVVV